MTSSIVARVVEQIIHKAEFAAASPRLRVRFNMRVGRSSLLLEDKETGDHFVLTVTKKKEQVWVR